MSQEPYPLYSGVHPQANSTNMSPIVAPDEILSVSDKIILYVSLQDIAQELRRI